MIFPTAREIAVAVVTAARLHDEDPVLTVEGAASHRGRWLAVAALQEAFPATDHAWIALSCGVMGRTRSQNARAEIRSKRFGKEYSRAKWFLEADLETVKADLAKAIAETNATPGHGLSAEVIVPQWVRDAGLVDDFTAAASATDELDAAALCRRLKHERSGARATP
jgi:hypothetical protein